MRSAYRVVSEHIVGASGGFNFRIGMIDLPRLALATPASGPEPSPASLAWLAGLTERRWRVQHFRSRACPIGDGGGRAGHRPPRPAPRRLADARAGLPPALRPRGAARPTSPWWRGRWTSRSRRWSAPHYDRPGGLRPIAEALDLPVVARGRRARRWHEFHLPQLPEGVDAVLLDGLEDPDDFELLRTG